MKQCVAYAGHRMAGTPVMRRGGADIYVCPDCGCMMADVSFEHEQYEDENYYTMSRQTHEGIEEEWGLRWRHILGRITRIGAGSTLLDVGAGNGFFVWLASHEYSLAATGLEVSNREVQFARDVLGVRLANESVAAHRERYSIVTCFNVLEHVDAPGGFLSELVQRIEPGGILALTTPNPGCLRARLLGIAGWGMLAPPHHINIFTKRALNTLLAAEPLDVISHETLSTYVRAVKAIDNSRGSLRRLAFNVLRLLGLGADHFVIARKLDR
jgi:2-polyprenyl-3-methyl-5-hydroxy-6-metoxy-1,4-benzoquinol methylase